jgi:hypothetical protein
LPLASNKAIALDDRPAVLGVGTGWKLPAIRGVSVFTTQDRQQSFQVNERISQNMGVFVTFSHAWPAGVFKQRSRGAA